MNRNTHRIAAGLLLIVSLAGPASRANAWTRSNFSERNGTADQDLRVPGGRLAFHIEPRGSFGISDGSDVRAIRDAFRSISAVSGSAAVIDDAGPVSYPSNVAARDGLKLDGSNNVYFFRQRDPSLAAIAITSVFYDPTTGDIREADIAINEADYGFSTADTETPDEPLSPNTFDIQEIVTHECMHALGFGHSAVIGRFDPATGCQVSGWSTGDFSLHSTMFPFASGTIAGRSLTSDDVAALTAVYPDGTTTGSIAGRLVDGSTGNGLKGAHVVAVRVDDPTTPIVGTISGIAEGDASGEFTIAGLPPGDYYVRIEPLVGTTNPFTQQMTTFTGFQTTFRPEFYSGQVESFWDTSIGMDDAVAIHIEAGSRESGVDFVTNNDPEDPSLAKASFKRGKLKISGSHFLPGMMEVEVDGYRVQGLRFSAKGILANGEATCILSTDTNLVAMMSASTTHSVVVLNTVTGVRSAPMIVQQ